MTTENPKACKIGIAPRSEEDPNLIKGKKPFYFTSWWLVLWSLLIWPLGLIMLWSYYANMKKHELPRTTSLKKDLSDL